MNDVMSFGIHRCWKNYFAGKLELRGEKLTVLDLAGGTGDIAFRIIDNISHNDHHKGMKIVVGDINEEMLRVGINRAREKGLMPFIDPPKEGVKEGATEFSSLPPLSFQKVDAEQIDFPSGSFDAVTMAFGLRNVSKIDKALESIHRVLKPGGVFMCLEFSKVTNPLMKGFHRIYNKTALPCMGKLIAGNYSAYEYLAASIEGFCSQEELLGKMCSAGFKGSHYENLSGGVVAIHYGVKVADNRSSHYVGVSC